MFRTVHRCAIRWLVLAFTCSAIGISSTSCIDYPAWEDVASADSAARLFIMALEDNGASAGRQYLFDPSYDDQQFMLTAESLGQLIRGADTDSLKLLEAEIIDEARRPGRRLVYQILGTDGLIVQIEIWMREARGTYFVDTFRFSTQAVELSNSLLNRPRE